MTIRTYSEIVESHREDRREQLLRVASEVICERGLHQTTMDQIAARIGLSKIVLYRQFGTRDKLVHAALERIVDLILEADDAPADWWTQRVQRTLQVARANAPAFKLVVRLASHDREFGRHYTRLCEAIVQRTNQRVSEILGEADGSSPGEERFLGESVTAHMLDAYVRWMEEGEPERDPVFLSWLHKSIRAMAYYWRGSWPPQTEPGDPAG